MTKIFHPNVSKPGEICVNVLKRDWKSDMGLRHVLVIVRCLLIEPFPGVITSLNLQLPWKASPGTHLELRYMMQLECLKVSDMLGLHGSDLKTKLKNWTILLHQILNY